MTDATVAVYRPAYAVVEELQHDSPRFYTSEVVQRWLYTLPNATTATAAQPTQPHNIFPIPLPMPLLLDFSNVAFLALYVAVCLAIGGAISLVLRYHSQHRRRNNTLGNALDNALAGAEATEETYLLL